jgi:rhodanese-related sulfurtransferase
MKDTVTLQFAVVLALLFLGFLYMNNVAHVGFHMWHTHDDEYMMNGHRDIVESYEISPAEVVDKIQDNADTILLDVRTPEEYAEIHLENALLLPVETLSMQTLSDIGLGEDAKNKEIIIYCRSGSRSKQAYDIMTSLGFTNLKSVSGGMVHWQEDGYPFTETGALKMMSSKQESVNTGPRISFDTSTYDFGDVPQSAGIIETTFTISNNGAGPLILGDITTSCGCTTAVVDEKVIDAGASTRLVVYFDPDFHDEPVGKITRTVFMPTNDPTLPEAEVRIMVDIQEGQ